MFHDCCIDNLADLCRSNYDNIPGHLKTDNVIPSASELPTLLDTIRHPKRRASISVGPQSEADAYEALAFRQSNFCRRTAV
jgi:hypothetical protein